MDPAKSTIAFARAGIDLDERAALLDVDLVDEVHVAAVLGEQVLEDEASGTYRAGVQHRGPGAHCRKRLVETLAACCGGEGACGQRLSGIDEVLDAQDMVEIQRANREHAHGLPPRLREYLADAGRICPCWRKGEAFGACARQEGEGMR